MAPVIFQSCKRRKGTAWKSYMRGPLVPAVPRVRRVPDPAFDFDSDDDNQSGTAFATGNRRRISPVSITPWEPPTTKKPKKRSTRPGSNGDTGQSLARAFAEVAAPRKNPCPPAEPSQAPAGADLDTAPVVPPVVANVSTDTDRTCDKTLKPLTREDAVLPVGSTLWIRWRGLLGSLWEARVESSAHANKGTYQIVYVYDGRQEAVDVLQEEIFVESTEPETPPLEKGRRVATHNATGELREWSILARHPHNKKYRVLDISNGSSIWMSLSAEQQPHLYAVASPAEAQAPVPQRRPSRRRGTMDET